MEKILLNLNANFVALLPNGFAGEQLTFVMGATKSNVAVTMFPNTRKINFQNAMEKILVL